MICLYLQTSTNVSADHAKMVVHALMLWMVIHVDVYQDIQELIVKQVINRQSIIKITFPQCCIFKSLIGNYMTYIIFIVDVSLII